MGMIYADQLWIDGQWVHQADAQLSVLSHTLHYGVGAFEGLRAYQTDNGPAIFRLHDHTERLFQSAEMLRIEVPFDRATLNQAQIDIIQRNQLSSAYIRPLLYLGEEALGLHSENCQTHIAIAAWEWGAYLGEESQQTGLSIVTSRYRRPHSDHSLSRAKACGNYVLSSLAARQANADGYHEALLLDYDDMVAEGSAANIFISKNGKLITPDDKAILLGITRDSVLQFARECGIEVEQRPLNRDEVYSADEAFFTGTAVGIVPIVRCDQRTIGNGQRGEITRLMQDTYEQLVSGRSDPTHPWLSYCND